VAYILVLLNLRHVVEDVFFLCYMHKKLAMRVGSYWILYFQSAHVSLQPRCTYILNRHTRKAFDHTVCMVSAFLQRGRKKNWSLAPGSEKDV